jgi:hypothetical protein
MQLIHQHKFRKVPTRITTGGTVKKHDRAFGFLVISAKRETAIGRIIHKVVRSVFWAEPKNEF